MNEANIYTVGGTVQAGGGIYISRQADEELLTLCRERVFAYVLTPRQMGKSSLMVRTAEKLAEEDIQSIMIDLTQLGVQLTAEQWYLGLLTIIEGTLTLDTDVVQWWQTHTHLGLTQRLTLFFQKVLLVEVTTPVVIFVDEIDTTLSLSFTDDFYAAIRYLYVARSLEKEFRRLSFVLIGVATPGDLIRDPKRTPFNIGQRVDLTDFTFDEAQPLADGLGLPQDEAQQVLSWVLLWTGGHPYLTQRLCSIIREQGKSHWSKADIDSIVSSTFLGAISEQDNNLQFVRDMLTKRAPDSEVLTTYREIRTGKRSVPDEEQSIVKSHLKLSGVVLRKNAVLKVRNPIYQQVFDRKWINEHLPLSLRDMWERLKPALPYLGGALVISMGALALYAFERTNEAQRQQIIAQKQSSEVIFALHLEIEALIESIKTGKQLQNTLRSHSAAVIGVAISPQGSTLASTSDDKTIKLWKIDGTLLTTLKGDQAPFYGVVFSPEGNLIASASGDKTVKLWKVLGKKPVLLTTLNGHKDVVWGVAFSPDGKMIASASWDNTIKLWKMDGTLLHTLKGHQARVWGVAFSPDGKMIASASGDNTVKLWKIDGTLLHTLKGHQAPVWQVTFSPDGKMIASASGDNTVKLWKINGTLLTTLKGHSAGVFGVSFSPDSKMIASASGDHTVKLWKVLGKLPVLLATLDVHKDRVWGVAFSPDSNTLASVSEDKTVILWNLNLDDLLVQGCNLVHDYLKTNPNVSESDRHLCDRIGTAK